MERQSVKRAFIVRPFGKKKFGKKQVTVNFEDVEKALIGPALKELNIEGRTTAEILESGNIRADMFQRLLTSDLVIADLTILSANVFYELGIRHALREKRTFLIFSRIEDEKFPFDLQTDRYLAYDHKAPGDSLLKLIASLQRTIASDVEDSPVFSLLPALRSQDPGRFMVVPPGFREEVQKAEAGGSAGMLALLADEVSGLLWEREALRLVARAQGRANLPNAAKDTWERLRLIDDSDGEANIELGSIYYGLGELDQSNLALNRVLESRIADPQQRAEAHALRARNAMTYWRRKLADTEPHMRGTVALQSPRLKESYDEFRRAFEEDLKNYGVGIEALARLTVWTNLIDRLPQAWDDAQESTIEADRHREVLHEDLKRLIAAVSLSIEIAKRQAAQEPGIDLRVGLAQFALLTSKKVERVRAAYREVVEYASPSDISDMRRFLAGFADTSVLTDHVAAATEVLDGSTVRVSSGTVAPARVLLFRSYGPELLSREAQVREWIRSVVEAETTACSGSANLMAIAGGACGGDILFHEICQELRLSSYMHLPFTRDQYIPAFVGGEPSWIERFRQLETAIPVTLMQPFRDMPKWLADRQGYTFLERWNSWMLSVARSAAKLVTLVAICDEMRSDNEGVADLVRKAKQTGVKPIIATPTSFDQPRGGS